MLKEENWVEFFLIGLVSNNSSDNDNKIPTSVESVVNGKNSLFILDQTVNHSKF